MKLNKKILSATLAGTMMCSSLALAFTDTDDHWAYKYIDYLSVKGIVDGYPDGSFQPEGLISREESAQMISNYIGGAEVGDSAIPADAQNRWSSKAISKLFVQKIIEGYADGSFKPENKITRAEFATMAYNLLEKQGKLKDQKNSFSDTSGHWAKTAVETLSGNGFIDGYPDGSFKPESRITRAEAATMLSKIDNGGDFFSIEDIFKDSVDPMPTIRSRMKEAIIATNKIPIERIGAIGSWSYPSTVSEADMKMSEEGLSIPYSNSEYGISELTIPYSRLLNVLTPEFIYSLKDQSLIDKIESGYSGKKRIALTFDDGPIAGTTTDILDILKAQGVKATFFVTGKSAATNKDILKRHISEGHEIGNHSWDHPYFADTPDSKIHQQVLSTEMAIYQATGQFSSFMRPPYGSIDSRSASAVGMPLIFWSFGNKDWNTNDPKKILEEVIAQSKDGDIILAHDTIQAAADSLDEVIVYLLGEGYEFVTISEMYGYDIHPGFTYHGSEDIRPAS